MLAEPAGPASNGTVCGRCSAAAALWAASYAELVSAPIPEAEIALDSTVGLSVNIRVLEFQAVFVRELANATAEVCAHADPLIYTPTVCYNVPEKRRGQ